MQIQQKFPLLYKILSNWHKEEQRPPLLLNGVREEDWAWLKEDIINIFTKNIIISNHPDILILEKEEKKQTIEVDKTRHFIEQLSLSDYELPLKIGIIPYAESLNVPSQNALLKTLEEPLPKRYLILGTLSKNKLLPTILSRSMVIELRRYNLPSPNESELRQEVIDLFDYCLKATSAKSMQKGIAWSTNNPHNIARFFDLLLPELRKRIKSQLFSNDKEQLQKLSYQIKKVLDCQDQLRKTSGANPKLLFEAFLLQLN